MALSPHWGAQSTARVASALRLTPKHRTAEILESGARVIEIASVQGDPKSGFCIERGLAECPVPVEVGMDHALVTAPTMPSIEGRGEPIHFNVSANGVRNGSPSSPASLMLLASGTTNKCGMSSRAV